MEYYPSNHSWVYDRNESGRRLLKQSFVAGVEEFISKAKQHCDYAEEGGIRCPCTKYNCMAVLSDDNVKLHLYRHGFKHNYWIWTDHDEELPDIDLNEVGGDDLEMGASGSGYHDEYVEQLQAMHMMVNDCLGQHENFEADESDDMEEPPNESVQRFYNLLLETNKPLFEGTSDSKLSICVRLLACKSNWNVPEQCLEFFCKMLQDVTPFKELLPKSYDDAKRLVSKLGLGAKRIDCCPNGCMLYYGSQSGTNDSALEECKFCQTPRYRVQSSDHSKRKPVLAKAMFYLPIIPRLQRLFASTQIAGQMRWHNENIRNPGVIRHPFDGEAWKHLDRVHPDFAADPRNVRLGLCSYGFYLVHLGVSLAIFMFASDCYNVHSSSRDVHVKIIYVSDLSHTGTIDLI